MKEVDIKLADGPKKDIWTNYDPKLVRERLKISAGALEGVDRDVLLKDIYAGRVQDTPGRPAL